MKLTVRMSDKSPKWGYVEKFDVYRYDNEGFITVITGLHVIGPGEATLTQPYVLRGGEFIPLNVIEEEMGIAKYIKAKKPFYSLIEDGYVIQLKVRLNFETGEYIPKKSILEVYTPEIKNCGVLDGTMFLRRILSHPPKLKELLHSLAAEVATCKGDKEVFLKSRCQKAIIPKDEVVNIF